MSVWNSVRSAVDRLTGDAANVSLAMDPQVVSPGQTVSVQIGVKNGLSPLEVRAVLFEIEAVEAIHLPRHADWTKVLSDAATAVATKQQTPAAVQSETTQYSGNTYEASVTVATALSLKPGEERKFQGTFRLPAQIQPSFEGKFAKHAWRVRARLDVLGTDPGSGWFSFRVVVPS